MQSTLDAVVVADDLTGAADTGVQFTALGAPAYLLSAESLSLDRPWMAAAAGLSIYTASRQLPAREAAERMRSVARAVSNLRPRWVYKKVDSCLRGNLGAEIDVLLDALGLDAALVAPALPAQGRSTVGGIHLVHGRPLAETEFANDPFAPVTSSSVVDVLAAQSRYPVGRSDMKDYGDARRLDRALQKERARGCRLIVFDAAEQGHLDQVAAVAIRAGGGLLPVGSAGLAASMVGQLAAGAIEEPPAIPVVERLLLVCGTVSRITRKQLDALFERYPGVRSELEPEWLIHASPKDLGRRASDLLGSRDSRILALAIGPLPPQGPGITPEHAAAGLVSLAGLASAIIRSGRVDGLFLAGGETADAFLRESGGEAIALEQELLPGLVLGRILGGVADGLPLVTKAGAFGQEQTLVALYERLSAGAGS